MAINRKGKTNDLQAFVRAAGRKKKGEKKTPLVEKNLPHGLRGECNEKKVRKLALARVKGVGGSRGSGVANEYRSYSRKREKGRACFEVTTRQGENHWARGEKLATPFSCGKREKKRSLEGIGGRSCKIEGDG